MPAETVTTKTLLHFNGNNIDDTGRVWTSIIPAPPGDHIEYSSSIKVFNSSLHLGNGAHIITDNHADFHFGSGDFTIDFWWRTPGNNAYGPCLGYATAKGWNFQLSSHNVYFYLYKVGGGYIELVSTTTLTIDTFYHIAAVRNGNTLKLYINGYEEDSEDITGISADDNATKCYVISDTVGGYIDEFRVVKGEAKWTIGFTPPTSEYYFNMVSPASGMLGINF